MKDEANIRQRNRRLAWLGAMLMLAMSGPLAQAAEEPGATLAEEKGCIACHGLDGVAIAPSYPNLAGQWERYLRLQLRAYRDGKRQNEIMAGFAAELSDDDIRELASFYGDD